MQDENDLNGMLTPGERELEMALGGVPPAAAGGRDELIFSAGARSARGSLRLWRLSTVGLAACTGLVMFVGKQTDPARIVRQESKNIIGPRAPAAAFAAERGPFTLAALNNLVLERGVEALPSASASPDDATRPATPSLRHNRSTELTPGDPL